MRLSNARGRSPHGERGLKSRTYKVNVDVLSRSPHGERGLKYLLRSKVTRNNDVALLMESVD